MNAKKKIEEMLELNSYTFMGHRTNFDRLVAIMGCKECRRDVALQAAYGILNFMTEEQAQEVLNKYYSNMLVN